METSPAAFLAVRYSPSAFSVIPFCLPNLRLCLAAAACLMIWDHLLTLDQEIDAIWISRNKGYLPKLIYVLNRYFAEGVLLYSAYGAHRPFTTSIQADAEQYGVGIATA